MVWQSFRHASDKPGTKLCLYFATLPADPDDRGSTTVDLVAIGAQGIVHSVELELLSEPAKLHWADGTSQLLEPGESVTIPARGKGRGAMLTFAGYTCSLKVCPNWPDSGSKGADGNDELVVVDGDDGSPPPPPTSGGGGNLE